MHVCHVRYSSDLGQSVRSRQKGWGLGWEENRLSRYDIRAEGFFYVLFNDALNTFLINGYIGVRNILIGKISSGCLQGLISD